MIGTLATSHTHLPLGIGVSIMRPARPVLVKSAPAMTTLLRFAVVLLLMAGVPACRHTPPPAEILPLANIRTDAEPRPAGGPAEISFNLPQFRPPDIDVAWLDADEFIPPGATVIFRRPERPRIQPTPRARFPSTEECVAIDGNAVVGTLSDKTQRDVKHRLLLYRAGDAASKTVLLTANTFEVLWSPDSEYVAVTEFVGRNSSEVFVVNRKDAAPERVDLGEVLARHFRTGLLDAPRFHKAYRWSDGPLLLIRVLGRLPVPPYEQFGCELLVDARSIAPHGNAAFELVSAFTKVPTSSAERRRDATHR